MEGVLIGENCNICDFVLIETGVVIGNNVTLKSGVYLWSGIEICDNVFVGPNATFTNDKFPQSGRRDKLPKKTILRKGCSIGANATVLPGVFIGEGSMVGAGAVVTKDVEPHSLVIGNPAKHVRFIK
jgi:acetyltransferase-like isoleucine patch superfamily enzyme